MPKSAQHVIPIDSPANLLQAGEGVLRECETTLAKLLQATLRLERLAADRDTEIAKIQRRYSGIIGMVSSESAGLEAKLQKLYKENRAALETEGRKSVQLTHGLLGMRSASNPALVPIDERADEKTVWETITAKVKARWKSRFLLPVKPRQIDKSALKRSLNAEQLKKLGLKLDDGETFYYELNRLAERQEMAA